MSTGNFDCVSCQLGKQPAVPFNTSESISTDIFDLIHSCKVVIYNYVLCWFYSMTKSVVIALILFLIFCGILLYWV